MTVIGLGAISSGGHELILCDGCGAMSINTPRFGWKRYRHKDIDIVMRHHCVTCQEYNGLLAGGLLMYGLDPKTAVTYENWEMAK